MAGDEIINVKTNIVANGIDGKNASHMVLGSDVFKCRYRCMVVLRETNISKEICLISNNISINIKNNLPYFITINLKKKILMSS